MKETKHKVVKKIGSDYFEMKISPGDIETLLDGKDKLEKHYLLDLMKRVGVTDVRIPGEELVEYGNSIPLDRKLNVIKGFVMREELERALHHFFKSAVSNVHVFKGSYVAMEKMQIYERMTKNGISYGINGLAQILREK